MKIVFDATHLAECEQHYLVPSGIYYTSLNILKELLKHPDLDVIVYCPVLLRPALKRLRQKEPELRNGSLLRGECDTFALRCLCRLPDIFAGLNELRLSLENEYRGLLQNIFFFALRAVLKLLKMFFAAVSRKFQKKDLPVLAGMDISGWISPCYAVPEIFRALPIQHYRTILYDTILLEDTRYAERKTRSLWLNQMLASVREGDTFAAISQCAKNDFRHLIPFMKDARIDVMPLAASEHFHRDNVPEHLAEVFQKYKLPAGKKYFLHLSYMDPRKNVMGMLRSFAKLIRENHLDDVIFVLAGKAGPAVLKKNEKELQAAGLSGKNVQAVGFVDYADLAPLYSNALAFLFMSSYEGFGLPVLEAMQCGTPVICSSSSSLPEVAGNAGIMIPWQDEDAAAQAMKRICFDSALRRELSEKAIRRAKEFSWKNSVDILLRPFWDQKTKKYTIQ